MKDQVIAILLGRKGSRSVKNKNTRDILGRPALHYPILAALNSKYIGRIFVSTDDPKIKREAKRFKAEIIDRPSELCTAKALFEDALVHAYKEVRIRLKRDPRYVVILMCNSVTIDSSLIDQGIELLERNPRADSAVTVSRFNMYSPLRARKKDKNGYLVPFVPFSAIGKKGSLSCDRDSQGDVYFADSGHSVVRPKCLKDIKHGLLPFRWMGRRILPVVNNYGCDIDAEWQVDMSCRWLKDRGFTKERTIY